MKQELQRFLKQRIVLDTQASWLYIGILEEVTHHCAVLSDVDVHDNSATPTSKEVYIMESKVTGGIPNRDLVYVNLNVVVSFSPLESVKHF
jgi:hypothetical protein